MLPFRLIFVLLFPLSLFSQVNLGFKQINPEGVALDPIGLKVFQNNKALLNTNSPFILKFNNFSDSAWRKGNYSIITCNQCQAHETMRVWNERIFSKGGFFTTDGGQTWTAAPNGNNGNITFLDSAFWLCQVNGRTRISRDRGQTWNNPNIPYAWLNVDDHSLSLWRGSDSSIFQLREDSLELLVHWPSLLPQTKPPVFYHQVDRHHFIFEVDYQLYTYNRTLDSLWLVDSSYFSRPATRLYTDGDVFIREDNLGDITFITDTTMNWISRNRQFQSASFAYSAGKLYYQSYLSNYPFRYGNLGLMRLLSNQKEIWGTNYNGLTERIYRRDNDSVFYGVPNKFVDGEGKILRGHGNTLTPDQIVGPVWINRNFPIKTSTDYGKTWNRIPSSTQVSPLPNYWHYLASSTRAEDTSCFIHFWNSTVDSGKIGIYNGLTSFINVYPAAYAGINISSYFKNCDTGVVCLADTLMVLAQGQIVKQAIPGNSTSELKRFGKFVYATTHNSGLYRSTDLINWQVFRGDINFMPDLILKDSICFKLSTNSHELLYTSSSNSISSKSLPAELSHVDKLNDSTVILSGFGGTVWHVSLNGNGAIGLAELEQKDAGSFVQIYPNPIQKGQILKWKLSSSEKISSVEIRDIRGQLILREIQPKSPQLEMDSKLPKGLYLIGFKLSSEMIWQQLLIR